MNTSRRAGGVDLSHHHLHARSRKRDEVLQTSLLLRRWHHLCNARLPRPQARSHLKNHPSEAQCKAIGNGQSSQTTAHSLPFATL